MNTKLWICVGAGVLVMHLALIFIVDHWHRLGAPPAPLPPEPTFSTTTYHYVDAAGREVMVDRQFKVNTKLADDATLAKQPPAPRTK